MSVCASSNDVELHAVDKGVIVDGARVSSALAKALKIGLAGPRNVIVGDRGERNQFYVVDLDGNRRTPVRSADSDLRSGPKPERYGDRAVSDAIAEIRAELHVLILSDAASDSAGNGAISAVGECGVLCARLVRGTFRRATMVRLVAREVSRERRSRWLSPGLCCDVRESDRKAAR